ncbi:sensor histidine kinase [Streptomyces sp. NPDC002506]|uniref:sensor histidine kinase n=1 Tax=Streptomyces sp. NPDC002506 TaxID=3154536 RepID=UPI0033330151
MKTGDVGKGRGDGSLVGDRLRMVARALRQDLLTVSEPVAERGRASEGWLAWRPALVVPLVIGAVIVMVGGTDEYAHRFHLGVQAGVALAGVQSGALVAALYRPLAAWWVTTAVTLVAGVWAGGRADPAVLFPWSGVGVGISALILFFVAITHRPRVVIETFVIGYGAGMLCVALAGERQNSPSGGLALVLFAIAGVVGGALRGRRVARKQLVVQEEITAEERARRTLLEERSRIARELHDVVAHHMSVISIQAQVAPHLVENPSDELRENLAGIRQNAVEALIELRRVLGVLRSEDPSAEAVRHAPQPSLDRLDELVANVRGAGLSVTADVLGTRRPLSPGVELSAFRIVQEALSNAMRHAPGAAVRILIAYHRAGLVVRVTNTAPARPVAPSPGAGHGLLGMRERTAMLGGELAVGATPDGGYEVSATLPLGESLGEPTGLPLGEPTGAPLGVLPLGSTPPQPEGTP